MKFHSLTRHSFQQLSYHSNQRSENAAEWYIYSLIYKQIRGSQEDFTGERRVMEQLTTMELITFSIG